MAKLVLSRSEAIVDQCFLDDARVTIGRAVGNRIVVDDPAVGDAHAAISAVGHDYILEDVCGMPLAVNGTPTRRRILQHGDVVELGPYHLRYIDTQASSEIDLERTMLIPGLALNPDMKPHDAGEITQDLHIPSARPTKARYPTARVKWMTGGRAGEVEPLDRVIATFGDAEDGLAVVTRRPHGFYLTYVEGASFPRVNGESIGKEPRHLQHGDVIGIAGIELEFATP
jgi:pSer/pThr/pTyr-binding forkhead associated (FHA) protein